MPTVSTSLFVCPGCRGALRSAPSGLVCPRCVDGGERRYPVVHGIQSFIEEPRLAKQDRYIRRVYDGLSFGYDASIVVMFAALGMRERDARAEILEDLTGPRNARLLEVSIGTGANVPLMKQRFPDAEIHGCDVSPGMLRKCQRRLERERLDVVLSHANASALPYPDGAFDAVLNVGGINSFADKKTALEEMFRVLKPGGVVVINDEGLSPEREQQFYARTLIKSIFWLVASLERGEMEPPLTLVPAGAERVRLRHLGRGYFWNLCFSKPRAAGA